jgi:ubiquinol-cytochrome c reductase cytochrome b subunit
MARLGDWLDERVGHRALVHALLDHPVPGGARWAYVFGATLLALFAVQAATGIALATVYTPSATTAWSSVAYIEGELPLGWLVRGAHATGASAIVVVAQLHLLQVALWGAYKRPREVTWWIGLALLGCVLAFSLTGYLLPWDQKGYWATQVATSLAGAVPGIGPWLQRLVQGGPQYGTVTLTHFYALHVLVLPLVTLALVAAHVALFRRHGVTALSSTSPGAPFWPHQAVRDVAAAAIAVGVVALLVVRAHHMGAVTLEAPADPASAYEARPEWYFLPLFQLLKLVPGSLEGVVAIAVPLVVGGALFALPLVDRGPSRAPRARLRYVVGVALIPVGAIALGALALVEDAGSEAHGKARARAETEARRALALARGGVGTRGGEAVWDNDPLTRGRAIFAERCAGCHLLGGVGERDAPDLDGWSSRAWIRDFLHAPSDERFYGRTKVRGMKPVKTATPEDFDALVEWIYSLGEEEGGPTAASAVDAAKVARGAAAFREYGCDDCHDLAPPPSADAEADGDGAPALEGRARASWLRAFLLTPGAPRFFGRKNDMPSMKGKLDDAELDAIVRLLRAERTREPPSASPSR